MIVRDQAAELELSGGLAAKAGEGYAHAKDGAKKATAKFDDAASKAVDKGAHGLGRMIGKAKSKVREAKASYDEAAGADPAQTSPGESKVASSSASADNGAKVAKAVGEQLGKTKGMFSGFIREFKEASK